MTYRTAHDIPTELRDDLARQLERTADKLSAEYDTYRSRVDASAPMDRLLSIPCAEWDDDDRTRWDHHVVVTRQRFYRRERACLQMVAMLDDPTY